MGTVRRRLGLWGIVAAVLCAAAPVAVAGEPDVPGGRVLQMQTAFNPGLPGAGEGVRTFAKAVKHMSGGALAIKIVEPGRIAPTKDMLDAVIAGDLEAEYLCGVAHGIFQIGRAQPDVSDIVQMYHHCLLASRAAGGAGMPLRLCFFLG